MVVFREDVEMAAVLVGTEEVFMPVGTAPVGGKMPLGVEGVVVAKGTDVGIKGIVEPFEPGVVRAFGIEIVGRRPPIRPSDELEVGLDDVPFLSEPPVGRRPPTILPRRPPELEVGAGDAPGEVPAAPEGGRMPSAIPPRRPPEGGAEAAAVDPGEPFDADEPRRPPTRPPTRPSEDGAGVVAADAPGEVADEPSEGRIPPTRPPTRPPEDEAGVAAVASGEPSDEDELPRRPPTRPPSSPPEDCVGVGAGVSAEMTLETPTVIPGDDVSVGPG